MGPLVLPPSLRREDAVGKIVTSTGRGAYFPFSTHATVCAIVVLDPKVATSSGETFVRFCITMK